jgi:hypothetical protein
MYKLSTATIGVANEHGKRVTVMIPEEAILELTSDRSPDGTVEVIWDGRRISVFEIDLQDRGYLIVGGARAAGKSD